SPGVLPGVLPSHGGVAQVLLSPTQSSLLLTVSTPSGPEVSLLPVKPAYCGLMNCLTPAARLLGSTTSIALLLRSAKKYFLSTGSTQLMSNEKNVDAP